MRIYTKRDGEQSGPFTIEKVVAMIQAGTLHQTDLAWHEGAEGWRPVSQCSFISRNVPPPTPSPAPSLPVTGPTVIIQNAPAQHVTTELTSKNLKGCLIMSWGMAGIGLFIVFGGSMGDSGEKNGTMAGTGLGLMLIGIVCAVLTRFRIWWNHK